MTTIKFQATEQQLHNCITLALGVARLPRHEPDFDMPHFECGTAACFAGWGPKFGIMRELGEDWSRYAVRVFGISFATDASHWLFSAHWQNIDNTPHGAAARMWWLLKHGEPPEDWRDQMQGYALLCYTPDGKAP